MITLEQVKADQIHKRFFISDDNGGLSKNIIVKNHSGNNGIYDPELDVLANCTAWATGRYNWLAGFDYNKYFGDSYASYFPAWAKKLGLTITTEPVVGGIMCWAEIGGGDGHVEVVEEISSDGNICYDSSSGYGLYLLKQKTRKRNTGGTNMWGFSSTKWEYLGCINPPK